MSWAGRPACAAHVSGVISFPASTKQRLALAKSMINGTSEEEAGRMETIGATPHYETWIANGVVSHRDSKVGHSVHGPVQKLDASKVL